MTLREEIEQIKLDTKEIMKIGQMLIEELEKIETGGKNEN